VRSTKQAGVILITSISSGIVRKTVHRTVRIFNKLLPFLTFLILQLRQTRLLNYIGMICCKVKGSCNTCEGRMTVFVYSNLAIGFGRKRFSESPTYQNTVYELDVMGNIAISRLLQFVLSNEMPRLLLLHYYQHYETTVYELGAMIKHE
jgi:hypothetical protein